MTRPSPRKVGKALPPYWILFGRAGTPIMALWNDAEREWARDIYKRSEGYRYVRYVPSLPRKAKGARRGK